VGANCGKEKTWNYKTGLKEKKGTNPRGREIVSCNRRGQDAHEKK